MDATPYVDRIPMRKIRALYRSAEEMVKEFHDTKSVEIEKIRELRAAGRQLATESVYIS